MKSKSSWKRDDILSILPHRPPFLFVDRVRKLVPDKNIIAERDIQAHEPYFTGHFPGKPIMPGVLVTDALAQTCGLLWGLSKKLHDESPDKEPEIFFLAAANMKFIAPAYPGECLTMKGYSEKSYGNLFTYSAEAAAGKKLIAKGTLTLAMVDDEL
ncbi:MAG: 3-hydroxyacyl-ACP dehydratase FabZ [Chitinivibrionales bacterium]|nr:3-hydroxyacyl-ACP dehydratase FabZ [Chitinivibrionales bacterium]